MKGKALAKHWAYRTGIYGLLHRLRNHRTLTVAMFHRVLPPSDERWRHCDPVWTVSERQFESCLRFFLKHYNIVSLDRLAAALESDQPALPPRALLVSFDDGWADSAEFAAPILARHGVPAVVFVAAGIVDSAQGFWQEKLIALERLERMDALPPELLAEVGKPGDARSLIKSLQALPPKERRALVESLPDIEGPPAMMSQRQVRELSRSGVAVGSHGFSHEPLTTVDDPSHELTRSRDALSELTGAPVASLSFPHSRWNPEILQSARDAGYRALFGGGESLNAWPAKPGQLLNRVAIHAASVTDDHEDIDPSLLANQLFLKPISKPDFR
jgi:peptidoglycan/xylan/chitin deacetylase (PgdA/CDA1 family)